MFFLVFLSMDKSSYNQDSWSRMTAYCNSYKNKCGLVVWECDWRTLPLTWFELAISLSRVLCCTPSPLCLLNSCMCNRSFEVFEAQGSKACCYVYILKPVWIHCMAQFMILQACINIITSSLNTWIQLDWVLSISIYPVEAVV